MGSLIDKARVISNRIDLDFKLHIRGTNDLRRSISGTGTLPVNTRVQWTFPRV